MMNQSIPPQQQMPNPSHMPSDKFGNMPQYGKPVPNRNSPVINGSSAPPQGMNPNYPPNQPGSYGAEHKLPNQMQNMHISGQRRDGPPGPRAPMSNQFQNGPGPNHPSMNGQSQPNNQMPGQPPAGANYPSMPPAGPGAGPNRMMPPGGLPGPNINQRQPMPGPNAPNKGMPGMPPPNVQNSGPGNMMQGPARPPTSMMGPQNPMQGPPKPSASMQAPPSSVQGPPRPPTAMNRPPGPMAGPGMTQAPPSSMPRQPGPPISMAGQPRPPTAMPGQPGPPNSMMGQPNPPSSMHAPPGPQNFQAPPSSNPSSMNGFMQNPPSRGPAPPGPVMMPAPPHAPGPMPPSSMAQMPPSSMGQMPPSSMGQMPPSSMGQMPPSSMGQMPPSSMGQMPPSSMGQMPPSSMGQMPPGAPPGSFPPMSTQQHYPQPPGGGMPPGGPNRPQMHPGMPQQPQAPRRLDPEQMPSPIQVIEDDMRTRSGEFYTNLKGQLPPLVTTKFTVQDQGNCSPRFMRSTIYNVPSSPDILKQSAVPFAISVSPFANVDEGEHPPPLVNLGEIGPVRCNRCKAYMCPYMQFIDGGRRFQCIFCKCTTEVPAEYFSHLDHTGQRSDKYQRPELCLGSYEFVATLDYCKNRKFPNPPAFIFMLDVSYNSIKSGLIHLLCQNMKSVLKSLPVDDDGVSKVRVGFVTYSNVLHFYNVKECLTQPQMMVVPDVHEMFMPLLDGFLVNPDEAEAVIDSLMEQIPTMFENSKETEIVLGPVIQAGLEALKAADCSGKLFIFHSTLPIGDAPGRLKNRDDRKVLGTDKEKSVLCPQNQFYNDLGQACVAAGCSIDLFTFPNAYVDLATIGQVCRLTGGQMFKYSYFQSDIDGSRFLEDLKRDVEKPIAFDAIMRIRTSTGVRPTDFFGNLFMSNTTDVELASVDCDKAIAAEIKHDDKLTEEDGVYIQAATLYTSVSGQRRLRVHNLSLNCCTQMADLFKSCELDTIMNFFAKQSMRVILDQNPKAVKDNYIQRTANILACYRKNCASPSSAGQLILPEGMKLLPIYTNCLIKCDALAGGSDLTTDDRSFFMQYMNYANVNSSLGYLYPRLFSMHDMGDGEGLPRPIRCSSEKLTDNGVYILENGIYLFLWIGLGADPTFLQNLFGTSVAAQIDTERTSELPVLENDISLKVRNVIDLLRCERHRYMKFTVVRQRDKLDLLFRNFLVEDKSVNGGASYVDFLYHMHKEIRSLLN